LYKQRKNGEFEKIKLLIFKKDRVKVEFEDGANSWVSMNQILTREMVESRREDIRQKNITEKRERERRAEAERNRIPECCCSKTKYQAKAIWEKTAKYRTTYKWMESDSCTGDSTNFWDERTVLNCTSKSYCGR